MLELSPGALVSGKLRLEKPLGQGGMGSVWLARHVALDTEVAVKFIRPERAALDPRLHQRFAREAKAAARIACPYVVQIKDYGLADDTPYIVMEHLRGQALDQRLRAEAPLSWSTVQTLVEQVGRALSSAHALGIVHRDIKPQNIFLSRTPNGDERVKVLDFGVAKVVTDGDSQVPDGTGLTETGTVVGSPPYMSPEQLEGRSDVDHRADLWSLGIVTYQALTGRLPFVGSSFVAVGAAVLRGTYAPLTELRPSLPREVDHWLAKVLSLDPAGRFETAEAMVEAFSALPAPPIDEAPPVSSGRGVAHATTAPAAIPARTVTSAGPAEPDIEPRSVADRPETESSVAVPVTRGRGGRRVWMGVAALVAAGGIGAVAVGLSGRSSGGATGGAEPAPTTTTASPGPVLRYPEGECPPGMIHVAGQSFSMGAQPGAEVRTDETPTHQVRVDGFCIDRTEVTVAAYAACETCEAAPTTVSWEGITPRTQNFWSRFCNAGRDDHDEHPINCVNWHQAKAYCASKGMRLPTEEEWELAARGDDQRPYPWGDDAPDHARVNACGQECRDTLTQLRAEVGADPWSSMYEGDDGAPSTSPVGRFPDGASPHGLLDVAGNVWEWTSSPYCPYDNLDCGDSRRVLRGGGWDLPDPNDVRVTRRHPGARRGRGYNIGFRCAWSSRI